MEKRIIQPAGLFSPGTYSHVTTVRGGRTIYLSGQIAFDAQGRLVGEGNLEAQTAQVFENLRIALTSADASFEDVIKMTIYVVDYRPEDLAVIVDVRMRYLSARHLPAITLVGVKALARPGLLIEIEAIAAVP